MRKPTRPSSVEMLAFLLDYLLDRMASGLLDSAEIDKAIIAVGYRATLNNFEAASPVLLCYKRVLLTNIVSRRVL